jgi:hypothetical protein
MLGSGGAAILVPGSGAGMTHNRAHDDACCGEIPIDRALLYDASKGAKHHGRRVLDGRTADLLPSGQPGAGLATADMVSAVRSFAATLAMSPVHRGFGVQRCPRERLERHGKTSRGARFIL